MLVCLLVQRLPEKREKSLTTKRRKQKKKKGYQLIILHCANIKVKGKCLVKSKSQPDGLAITRVIRTKDANYTEGGKKESADCESENQLPGVFSLNERRMQTSRAREAARGTGVV